MGAGVGDIGGNISYALPFLAKLDVLWKNSKQTAKQISSLFHHHYSRDFAVKHEYDCVVTSTDEAAMTGANNVRICTMLETCITLSLFLHNNF